MKIEVKITNTTPVFSAAAGSEYVALDGTFNPPLNVARFPVTRCRQMPVIADSGDGVARKQFLPVVPGNTMRNALRRSLLENYLIPALTSNNETLSINAYAAAYAGAASGNPDGMVDNYDDIVRLRNHVFLGLFGGGPRMLEGRLQVDTLYPIHRNSLRILGDTYINDAVSGQITDLVWTRRNDPVLAINSVEQTEVITNGAAAVNSWITELSTPVKGKKESEDESEGESVRGLRAFNAHEVVIPGVSWLWRLNLDNPTPEQVGGVLLAITKMDGINIAGGHARDYGRIALEAITVDGEPCWSSAGFEGVDDYLDSFSEALDSISNSDFEGFAASKKAAK